MIKKSISSLVLFLLVTTSSFAQYEKFGKLTPDLNKPDYSLIDSTSAAVVIFDVAKLNINKELQVEMETHKRVLIKNENGYDHGTLVIVYYGKNNYENIVDLQAINWVPVGKNKYKKVKLSKKDIFKENVSNGKTQLKFTLPNLTPGCIVEYKYTFRRDNLQKLPKWYFQTTIPVMYSQFETDFPSFFNFEFDLKGSLGITDRTLETYEGNFYFRMQRGTYNTSASSVQTGSIRTNYVKNKLYMTDIPAFESEPYSPSTNNLISALDVSLRTIFWPNGSPTEFFTNWKKTGDDILKDEDIANYFKETSDIEDDLKALSLDSLSAEAKAEKIYTYITKTYKFNDDLGLFPDISSSKLHKEKNGNSSSLNLLYFELCKLSGLEVYPVAISTKGKGAVNHRIQSMYQFNNIITEVILSGKSVFVDATDSLRAYNHLPSYDLNGEGLRLQKDSKSDWIAISDLSSTNEFVTSEFKIDDDGSIYGFVKIKYTGFQALNFRHDFESFSDTSKIEDFFKDRYFSSLDGISLDSITVKDISLVNEPTEINMTFRLENYATISDDRIYINPLFFSVYKKNPFTKEKRRFPIDYNYTFTDKITIILDMPEGYEVEEKMTPIQFSSPDKKLIFRKLTQYNPSQIYYISDLKVLSEQFPNNKYEIVKEFYQNVVDQQSKTLVLKKVEGASSEK